MLQIGNHWPTQPVCGANMTPIQLARHAAMEEEIHQIATQIITVHQLTTFVHNPQYGESKPFEFYIDEVDISTDQVLIKYTEYGVYGHHEQSSHAVTTTEFCDPNVLLDSVTC